MIYLQLIWAFLKRFWAPMLAAAITGAVILYVGGLRNQINALKNENNRLRIEKAEANAKSLAKEAAYRIELAKAQAKAAQIKVEYRDRWRTIEKEVVPEDCAEAVSWAALWHHKLTEGFND